MTLRRLLLGCALAQLAVPAALEAAPAVRKAARTGAARARSTSTAGEVADPAGLGEAVAKRRPPAKARPARRPTPARVDSAHPLPVVVLLDGSRSTRNRMAGDGRRIADALHGAGEGLVESLLIYSQHGEDEVTGAPTFKPYFRLGVLRYSTYSRWLLGSDGGLLDMDDAFAEGEETHDPSRPPLRWLGEPEIEGHTDMGAAFARARPVLERFVAAHPDAQAPIVINVSDGRPYGGRMQHIAEARAMRDVATRNGKAVVMNVHVSPDGVPLVFPTRAQIIATVKDPKAQAHALTMFEMSSELPPAMAKLAAARLKEQFPTLDIKKGARAMVMNAHGLMLPTLLEIGTVQAQHAVGTR